MIERIGEYDEDETENLTKAGEFLWNNIGSLKMTLRRGWMKETDKGKALRTTFC
jgi:hypothetical protein